MSKSGSTSDGYRELSVRANSWVFRITISVRNYPGFPFLPDGAYSQSPDFRKVLAARFSRAVKWEIETSGEMRMEYCKVAYEIGKGGSHHLQGYCGFEHAEKGREYKPTGRTVKMFLQKLSGSKSPEVQHRRGSHEEADSYPGKEEKDGSVVWVVSFGDSSRMGQGSKEVSKNDKNVALDDILAMILSGASKQEVWRKHYRYMVYNYRGVYEMAAQLVGDRWSND